MLLNEELTLNELIRILDNSYDEIFIWDENYRAIYCNNAAYRHIGVSSGDILGKTIDECTANENWWHPTCVKATFKEKRAIIQQQKTFLGLNITTISIPVFDRPGHVKYVLQTARQDESELFRMMSPNMPDYTDNDTETSVSKTSIIYKSSVMKKTMESADKIASTDATVLILGETGTGKSLLAKYIHEHSPRHEKPFVSINVSSLNPNIIESELFGYEKGAFTGADKEGKKGLFEMADGGTIFLDEIGELTYELQSKFLHTLQEGTITPVGSGQTKRLDLRIICATNCELKNMVAAGKFREDLYHRLNVFDIIIPPIRMRKDDIKPLCAYFLHLFNKKYNKNVDISEDVLSLFFRYPWHGNVRELSNVIERGVLSAEGDVFGFNSLPETFFSIDNMKTSDFNCPFSYQRAMEDYESNIIREAYKRAGSSRKLAEYLQISQTKANKLIQKYITQPPKKN